MRAIQVHTPHTGQVAGLDCTNLRFPYVGDKAADDDDAAATVIDDQIQKWDNRNGVETFPKLVAAVKQRYAVEGVPFPEGISVEKLTEREAPGEGPGPRRLFGPPVPHRASG